MIGSDAPMHDLFDHVGKQILRGALEPTGKVVVGLEIPSTDPQAADTWYEPDAARDADRARLGLLGRMAAAPTLFEPFHDTPGFDEFRACFRKQLTQDHHRVLDARKASDPRPPFPHLWMITTGRPESALRGYGLLPMPGWPPGFHAGSEADARGVVVLRDLPRTRDTLLLRLMGHGTVLAAALDELASLPADAWERDVAIPPLVAVRLQLPQDSEDEEARALRMNMMAVYEEWKSKVEADARRQGVALGREEGVALGREEGREESGKQNLLALYEARFGPVPPEVRAAIDAAHDPATLQRWTVLAGTRSEAEVRAAFLAPPAA